jgi:hypothetical protein
MILSTNIGIVVIVLKSRGNVERIKNSRKKFSLEKEEPARQSVYNRQFFQQDGALQVGKAVRYAVRDVLSRFKI